MSISVSSFLSVHEAQGTSRIVVFLHSKQNTPEADKIQKLWKMERRVRATD